MAAPASSSFRSGEVIGYATINRFVSESIWVRGVDLKHPTFETFACDELRSGFWGSSKISNPDS